MIRQPNQRYLKFFPSIWSIGDEGLLKSHRLMLDAGYWICIKYPVSVFGFIQYHSVRTVEP